MIKYALIDTGNITNTYIKALSELTDSTLVGCVSRSGRKLSNAANIPC